jgi:hypothetical protein
MDNKPLKKAAEQFREDAPDLFSNKVSVVFLCGPTLEDLTKPSALLRKHIKDALESEGFDVVLGEDDGLENVRLSHGHFYAHVNEHVFVEKYCNAIVLIADSVGTFCELGLFSFQKAHSKNANPDFILIANKDHETGKSFFNSGPAQAVKDFGIVHYADFGTFNIELVVDRLKRKRAMFVLDKRGRPPGQKRTLK